MEDWLNDLVALRNAEVVREYEQEEDDRRGLHHAGWCNGAVTHWLRCKRSGTNFWPWFDTSEGATGARSVMTRAKMLKADVPDHEDPACATATAVLEGHGMTRVYYGNTFARNGVTLYQEISAMHGGGRYAFIALFGGVGGHALGAVWGMSQMSFFDPNAGDFSLSRGQARAFLSAYLDHYEQTSTAVAAYS